MLYQGFYQQRQPIRRVAVVPSVKVEVPQLLFNLVGPQSDPFGELGVGLGGVVLYRFGDGGVVDVEEYYEIFLTFLYQVL